MDLDNRIIVDTLIEVKPTVFAQNSRFLSNFEFQRLYSGDMKTSDSQRLLAEYAKTGSEAAFRELVGEMSVLNLNLARKSKLPGAQPRLSRTRSEYAVFIIISPYKPDKNQVFRDSGWTVFFSYVLKYNQICPEE